MIRLNKWETREKEEEKNGSNKSVIAVNLEYPFKKQKKKKWSFVHCAHQTMHQ